MVKRDWVVVLGFVAILYGCSDRGASGVTDERTAVTTNALLNADVPTNVGGNEPELAISPIDPDIIALAGCSQVSLSFDGGQSFPESVPFVTPAGYGGGVCDAVVTFDSHGRLFLTFPAFFNSPGAETDLFVQQIDARAPGLAVASRRLDAVGNECGQPGADATQCPINVTQKVGRLSCRNGVPGRSVDKPWLVADARPACGAPVPPASSRTCTTFQDHLYVSWLDSPCCRPGDPPCAGDGGPQGQSVASSSDQGATWVHQTFTDDPGPSPSHLAVGANGDVYLGFHTSDGAVVVHRSSDGSALGFGARSVPFPAPLAAVTSNSPQQCECPGSTCASDTSRGCSFADGHCPGPNCECPANDCTPDAFCSNTPIPGWRPCPGRLETTGAFAPGTASPFIVADPTNPNNVAVFASTDPNPAGTARDNLDVNYVLSTNAASGSLTWASAPSSVTPGGAPLPATNQLFPTAATGSNGACVTVLYYDDRNPILNSAGNSQLDVFVTVNPDLWSGRPWQPEVQLNDAPFDPDSSAGDFSPFCRSGGYPTCVEPVGWRKTIRMGEYHGLLQASGAAWTGNGSGGGQQVFFEYSDGIPPVITAPAATTVSSCNPDAAAIGSATATDECGKPELRITSDLEALLPLRLGSNTLTWTATDGAANSATAEQVVTVQDATGPTFTVFPPDVTTSSCTSVNLGQAFAADDCGGAVTITNDAPARFPLGTTVVTWTARDARGNTRTATQRVTAVLGDDPTCCPAGTRVILGTSNNDTLNGTNGSDCILGRGSQDTINGNGGNDFISGGGGDDRISGGDGNDVIFGGSGQDNLSGNAGSDSLYGGDGDDTVLGGSGDDVLDGGQGQDVLQGEDGNDLLFGEDGDDKLFGGNGNDTLAGGVNNDTCDGGAGINIFEQCEFGAPNSCADGVQDGSETAVDCGGGCPGCATGATCFSGNDCSSGVCSAGLCQALPGGIRVVAAVQTDWGAGYCITLRVTNASSMPTTNWTATLDTNQSSITSSWNASFSGGSGVIGIEPSFASNQVIDPGETDTSIGFCANRNSAGSGRLPIVLGATGTF